MYSIPNPPFTLPVFDILTEQNKSWLTIRNDDIYSMRWANVDFARQFVQSIPSSDKVAGYYMGADGYCLGRDYLNKNTLKNPPLVFKKQWVSNMLWGRLTYDPTLPKSIFEENIRQRFAGNATPSLMKAWEASSMIFPFITRFVWGDIDLKWFPEANISHPKHKGFYTVEEYIKRQPMDGSNIAGIAQWLHDSTSQKTMLSPLSAADSLDRLAQTSLKYLKLLPAFLINNQSELTQTSSDIEAFTMIGLYYSHKIRAAYHLALFDKNNQINDQTKSLTLLKKAEEYWNKYATIYTANNSPALYNRVGFVDMDRLKLEVKKDVEIVQNWKVGSIKYAKRITTEKTFKE